MAIWSRQKIFRLSKGYYSKSNNCFRIALRRVFKALQYEYISRKVRRRQVRQDWIRSLNSALRDQDVRYSAFIYCLNRSNIKLDRKILSELAQREPYSFKAVVDEVMSQVQLPASQVMKSLPITYHQALDKKMLYFGQFDPTTVKDIPFKYVRNVDPNAKDWYGTHREDFPTFYKEQKDKFLNEHQMSTNQMKKHRFTAWDDVPSDADDE